MLPMHNSFSRAGKQIMLFTTRWRNSFSRGKNNYALCIPITVDRGLQPKLYYVRFTKSPNNNAHEMEIDVMHRKMADSGAVPAVGGLTQCGIP